MADEQECPKCAKGAPLWMVTFGDLMSLLLTFFVLLLSFANMDMTKYKEVLGSVEKAFGSQKERLLLGTIEEEPEIRKEIPNYPKVSEIDKKKKKLIELINDRIREESLTESISIIEDQKGVRLEIQGGIMFKPGGITLLPQAKALFQKLIPIIRTSGSPKISVEGHSDNVPFKNAKFPSNWELSAARAGSVVRYMIKVGRLPKRKFVAEGYADNRSITDNSTPAKRAKNRRVAIVFEVY